MHQDTHAFVPQKRSPQKTSVFSMRNYSASQDIKAIAHMNSFENRVRGSVRWVLRELWESRAVWRDARDVKERKMTARVYAGEIETHE